ncbi:hypothetical protein JXL21_10790 [Candidatus Bathyarchaeota archaeon]|nr:hypothetical protein [Candidatus Bathyarchaeota archaeon]
MKTKSKTLMVMALIVASVLASSMVTIMAAAEESSDIQTPEAFSTRVERVESAKQSLRTTIQEKLQAIRPEALDVDDLSEDEIEDRLDKALNAPETDDGDNGANPLWIARATGSAWPLRNADTSDTDLTKAIGTMFAATKIKTTEYGVVYDIVWGIVGHGGERVGVKGIAILGSDGVFVMKLQGDDLSLAAIGKVGRAGFGVRLAMKGYMSHDGDSYGFRMSGRAYPLSFNWRQPATATAESLTPSSAVKVAPRASVN